MNAPEKSKTVMLASPVTIQELDFNAPEVPAHPRQFAIWIRTLLQGWRQGTVSSQGRSDVSRTGKKPWKQKGTGRARAGDSASPLWRGGGVIFGPQPRTKTLKVTQATKKKVLSTLLVQYLNNKQVVMANWAPQEKPKTAEAFKLINGLGFANKTVVLFLQPGDIASYASFINIPNIRILLFDQPNLFDLAKSDYWLFLEKDREAFKEMVGQWQ